MPSSPDTGLLLGKVDYRESDWVVTDGLEPADRIVVEGIQKIRNGAKVAPQSNVAAPGTAPAAPVAPEG